MNYKGTEVPSADQGHLQRYAFGSWAERRPELPTLWQMGIGTPLEGEANGCEDEMSMETCWVLLLTFHEDRPGLQSTRSLPVWRQQADWRQAFILVGSHSELSFSTE